MEADRAQSVLRSEIVTGPDASDWVGRPPGDPQTAREPIGPEAIVVDSKSGSTLYLLRALGRLMQGGLHA